MTTAEPQGTNPQYFTDPATGVLWSADRHYWWNGQAWIPAMPAPAARPKPGIASPLIIIAVGLFILWIDAGRAMAGALDGKDVGYAVGFWSVGAIPVALGVWWLRRRLRQRSAAPLPG